MLKDSAGQSTLSPQARTGGEKTNLFIHIGYSRTGSSYLQIHLFNKMAGYMPEADFVEDFDAALDAVRKQSALTPDFMIISNESFSSTMHADRLDLPAALHECLPDAKIVIVIRSQFSIFRSFYHLYVKGGGTDRYEKFVQDHAGSLFCYDDLVSRYRDLFGPDNVLTLLFEDFVRAPQDYLSNLLAFLGKDMPRQDLNTGVREKASAGDLTMKVLRWRNMLILPVLRKISPELLRRFRKTGIFGSRFLEKALGKTRFATVPAGRARDIIANAYATRNASLFETLGIDITRYDYPQPDPVHEN